MHRACPDMWNREVLHLAGFWIEPRNLVGHAKIRNPQKSIFVRSGAEWHAARPWHIVFDIDNVHGLAAEWPDSVFIARHIRRRFRQHGIGPEKAGQVSSDILGVFIAEVLAQKHAETHGVAHERDTIPPAVSIARDRSHAALKLMANIAVGEN